MGKRAHSAAVSEVKKQLQAVGATSYQLEKPEVVELAKIIFEQEKITAYVLGWYDSGYGMLVATTKRILFIDKMFYGLKVEDIPFHVIGSVEYDLGWFFGKLKLYTRSGDFNFRWAKKSDVVLFAETIEKIIIAQDERDR